MEAIGSLRSWNFSFGGCFPVTKLWGQVGWQVPWCVHYITGEMRGTKCAPDNTFIAGFKQTQRDIHSDTRVPVH